MRVNAQENEASFVQPGLQKIVKSVPVFSQICVQKKIAKFHWKLTECLFSETFQ